MVYIMVHMVKIRWSDNHMPISGTQKYIFIDLTLKFMFLYLCLFNLLYALISQQTIQNILHKMKWTNFWKLIAYNYKCIKIILNYKYFLLF
jgi:hypothetical protein